MEASRCGAQALGARASGVAAHGLSSCGLWDSRVQALRCSLAFPNVNILLFVEVTLRVKRAGLERA